MNSGLSIYTAIMDHDKGTPSNHFFLAAVALLLTCAAAKAEMTDDQKLQWFMAQPENKAILASDLTDDEKLEKVLAVPKNRQTLGPDLIQFAPSLLPNLSASGATAPAAGSSAIGGSQTRGIRGGGIRQKEIHARQAHPARRNAAEKTPKRGDHAANQAAEQARNTAAQGGADGRGQSEILPGNSQNVGAGAGVGYGAASPAPTASAVGSSSGGGGGVGGMTPPPAPQSAPKPEQKTAATADAPAAAAGFAPAPPAAASAGGAVFGACGGSNDTSCRPDPNAKRPDQIMIPLKPGETVTDSNDYGVAWVKDANGNFLYAVSNNPAGVPQGSGLGLNVPVYISPVPLKPWVNPVTGKKAGTAPSPAPAPAPVVASPTPPPAPAPAPRKRIDRD